MRVLPFRWKSILVLLIFSAALFFTGALAEKMGCLLEGVENGLPGAWQKIKDFISEKFIFRVDKPGLGPESPGTPAKILLKGVCLIRGP